ncbi:hypothetical protein [Campylobacter concisus]|jgi:hypothetical protein
MKKILVATAVAGMFVTTGFSFEDYDTFVKNYTEGAAKYQGIYIGSIIEPDSGAVVGFAGCDGSGYYFNFNVINTYTGYTDEITIHPDIPDKQKACKVINTADKTELVKQITGNDGKVYDFGTVEYNGREECVTQYLDVSNTKEGITVPVTNRVCFGKMPYDPFREKYKLIDYTGNAAHYFNTNYKTIMNWNKDHSDKINALWLDKDKENRYAYSTEEIKELALKSNTLGSVVDQDGVLLYTLGRLVGDKPALFIGDKTIELTDEMLEKAPSLKAMYNLRKQAEGKARYFIGCEDSVAIAEGTEGVPTGYVYSVFNNIEYAKFPLVNAKSKGLSPFVCDKKMNGKELNKKQYDTLVEAGFLLSKPIIIDDNKTKEIDEDEHADEQVQIGAMTKPSVNKQETKTDNSPKGKIVELLKSADMPGLKIDEKGRYLGKVVANGEGTIVIILPNDEELEFDVPADNTLNKIGKDIVASARDLNNVVYAYGCDIPLVEKPGKNTPEIGVIYAVYNGHAVGVIPAFINGSFKCNHNMVNREMTEKDFFDLYGLAIEKAKQHPAFK